MSRGLWVRLSRAWLVFGKILRHERWTTPATIPLPGRFALSSEEHGVIAVGAGKSHLHQFSSVVQYLKIPRAGRAVLRSYVRTGDADSRLPR